MEGLICKTGFFIGEYRGQYPGGSAMLSNALGKYLLPHTCRTWLDVEVNGDRQRPPSIQYS